ncbi:hypothetical protein [Nocardioides marmorisolisilvae]|uniref:Uncharacterized protein n=1 Tax=Nocardioides marmorisolisilvae TaxID=1542737 RepID=A0A3N0DUY7_9ACTN|nr:hypothetical protein [Nocardioides marmorisolisilvae]RNL79437.1 hypothetical protein EFL95_10650 [Nocardioides marmorisolisilvae]
MTSADAWFGLLPELETWAEVQVGGPDSMTLTCAGVSRELRLTPDQWDDIVSIPFGGNTEGAAGLIRAAWGRAGASDRFLVYDGQYDVQPSPTAAWVDPGRAAFEAAVDEALQAGRQGLHWSAERDQT